VFLRKENNLLSLPLDRAANMKKSYKKFRRKNYNCRSCGDLKVTAVLFSCSLATQNFVFYVVIGILGQKYHYIQKSKRESFIS